MAAAIAADRSTATDRRAAATRLPPRTVAPERIQKALPESPRMTADDSQTNPPSPEFDFSRFPEDTLFHERRTGSDRRHRGDAGQPGAAGPRQEIGDQHRRKKERRRRIDPTTFEKQYTDDELEFMSAMQRFKELSGKMFPSYGDVLKVAIMLGYRRAVFEFDVPPDGSQDFDPSLILASVEHN